MIFLFSSPEARLISDFLNSFKKTLYKMTTHVRSYIYIIVVKAVVIVFMSEGSVVVHYIRIVNAVVIVFFSEGSVKIDYIMIFNIFVFVTVDNNGAETGTNQTPAPLVSMAFVEQLVASIDIVQNDSVTVAGEKFTHYLIFILILKLEKVLSFKKHTF